MRVYVFQRHNNFIVECKKLQFFLPFALISQMFPYLIFIVMSKTTDFLNMALVSQNAQFFHLTAPLCSLTM